ncbi:MAG TPA: hypothetical protein VLX92_03070 [Kofleriaceae bacterium]|nr:hypothetical protein [Kofleriaceae bacterium]
MRIALIVEGVYDVHALLLLPSVEPLLSVVDLGASVVDGLLLLRQPTSAIGTSIMRAKTFIGAHPMTSRG